MKVGTEALLSNSIYSVDKRVLTHWDWEVDRTEGQRYLVTVLLLSK